MNESFAHHLDAEDDVIAAALYYGGAAAIAAAQLEESQLMRPANQAILAALQEHASTGEVVDIATIVATLRRIGRLEEAGGVGGVADTSNRYTLTERGVEGAVQRVQSNAKRRRLHQIAHRLAEHAQDDSLDVDRLAAAAIPHLALTGTSSRSETTLADEAVAVYDALGEDAPTDVVSWPLSKLGRNVGPQRPGWMVVSGGWTSHGKSWFGLDCAELALDEGRRVLYVTLEMPAREVAERMIARAGVDLGALQGGGVNRASGMRMSDADYALAHRRSTELYGGKGRRMTIVDGSTDVRQVLGRMAAAEAMGDPYRYVVIDTLNLLGLPRANSRREAIDEALKLLKHGAVRHGATIHVQAQLGRSDDKQMRPPRLQDYKESGGIEQIADVALFVHREMSESREWTDAGMVIVAKGRSAARLGVIDTRWDGGTYRFVQASPSHGLGGVA